MALLTLSLVAVPVSLYDLHLPGQALLGIMQGLHCLGLLPLHTHHASHLLASRLIDWFICLIDGWISTGTWFVCESINGLPNLQAELCLWVLITLHAKFAC